MHHEPVRARLEPLIENRLIATCSIVLLEVLYSARSRDDYRRTKARLSLALELAPIDQAVLDRAVELQGLLADSGQHRAASLPDLTIAATAERAGLTVLHYDADFDRIAQVSDQPAEWVVTRGSVP